MWMRGDIVSDMVRDGTGAMSPHGGQTSGTGPGARYRRLVDRRFAGPRIAAITNDRVPQREPRYRWKDQMPTDPANAVEPAGLPDAELRQLHQILLGMLDDVAVVCEKLDIPFFLAEGTLIGAVRHHGFVPWDDDLDLYMLRSDYERFLRLAPELLGERYRVQHSSTVENYWSAFLKVRLTDGPQRFQQAHISHLTRENGPLIDVFPVEFVPRDRGPGLTLQSAYLRFLRGCLVQKLAVEPAERPIKRLLRAASRLLTLRFIHRQLDRTLRLHGDRPLPYAAMLATFHPLRCQVVPAEVFAHQEWVDFEGSRMPVPVGYHPLLTTIYGDYRIPPPPAERGLRHQFVISPPSPLEPGGLP
jgi:lipopolysaccharide cholinephosphotransferase